MKIVMIGTGNVATVLGRLILHSEHSILQVVGRNATDAKALGSLLDAEACSNFSAIMPTADFYIIAVSDTALADIEHWLVSKMEGIVVHTAGSVSMQVLQNVAQKHGVLYPLQSLRSDREVIPEIPFLIDGDSTKTLETIRLFASSLSKKVQYADDANRMKLHAGAVISGNFTNFLYTLTQDYCTREAVDFSLLFPLLYETVNRMEQYPPASMQTGPAIRNDQSTIAKHLSLLQFYPELTKMYTVLSNSILNYYNKQKAD